MRERPILFSAPMVRAILAGTKTQTRRVVKARKDCDFGCELAPHELAGEANGGDFRNAYCAPGDRLWVREAWCTSAAFDKTAPKELPKDAPITYLAGGPHHRFSRYRPPMFMPRWASRITLEVTGVRVERLQDISEADAIAEGIAKPAGSQFWHADPRGSSLPGGTPQWAFRNLWESINGPGSWDANPWVWVVEFKRAEVA